MAVSGPLQASTELGWLQGGVSPRGLGQRREGASWRFRAAPCCELLWGHQKRERRIQTLPLRRWWWQGGNLPPLSCTVSARRLDAPAL